MDTNAGNHNQTDSTNEKKFVESSQRREISGNKIVATITISASILGILAWFGLTPANGQKEINRSGDTFNVESHNQSGGITAGQINIGNQQRRLTDSIRQQLLDQLPRDKKVKVESPMGDSEAEQYAYEIKQFLESEGYNVSRVLSIYTIPPKTQGIFPTDDGFKIVIKSNMQ